MEAVHVKVGRGVFHLGPDVAVDGLAAVLDAPASRSHRLHRGLHRRVRLQLAVNWKCCSPTPKYQDKKLFEAFESFKRNRPFFVGVYQTGSDSW